MKKLIALLMCLCLVLGVLAGCGQGTAESDATEEAAAETETVDTAVEEETAEADAAEAEEAAEADDAAAEPEETAEPAGVGHGGTGYETYPADMVVATVNGTDVTWMEYFYWLNYYTDYVQQFAAQYGVVLDGWDAYDLSGDNTNAEVVIMNAQTNIVQDHVIRTETEKLGVELTAEDEAELEAVFDQNADMATGDGDGETTDEERQAFEAYLADEMYVDKDFFHAFNAVYLLSQRGFEIEYGENGVNFSDEDTLTFAEDNGVLAAKHILLLTVDPETYEALSEEEVAEKLATAEDLLAQLQAVQDDPEALAALFDELTAEYTEDTGYAAYPDGYVFSEGEMVAAFEEAVKAMEIGGLSEVVESEYGYHIILRIPVDPDAVIGTDSNGNEISLRYAAASQQYNAQLAAWAEAAEVVWSDGFETPDLAAIFG